MTICSGADAIIFGTPTRCGLPTAQLKQFLDTQPGRFGLKGRRSTRFVHRSRVLALLTVARRPRSSVTLTRFSSKLEIPTARYSRATTAPLNRTRLRWRQGAFKAGA
jgi:multimeric flavodoxin WrbA